MGKWGGVMEILKFIRFKDMNDVFGGALKFEKISSKFHIVCLHDVMENLSLLSDRKIILDDNLDYQEPTLSSKTNTISISKKGKGKDFKVKNRTLIKKGDLVISKMHTQNGLFAFSDTEYHSTSTFIPFALKSNVFKDYVFILLKPTLARLYKNDSVKRETYKVDEILNLEIPLPDINIQKSLVSAYQEKIKQAEILEMQADFGLSGYLDEKLGIQQSQNHIQQGKLLFARFKDLDKWGINAIFAQETEYSQNFTIKKVRELCKVSSGGTPSRSHQDYYKGDIAWIKTGEVLNNVILETEEYITQQAIENSSAKLYPVGSLVIAMYGQGLTRGRTAKLGINATTNQACAVLSKIDNNIVLTDYLWAYLMNEYDRLRALASGNNQPNLNAEMIKNYPVIIPDLDMQQAIINDFFEKKGQQKQAKTQAKILREQAIEEFEKAVFE